MNNILNNIFNGVYSGKKVLVTGHTGFKGSWLCVWLNELGANVIGYSLSPITVPSMFEVCELKERITSIIGDICDLDHLTQVIEEFQPEIIFHLAAQPLVRDSYLNPKKTYESNVIGTLNLYEASRQSKSVKVIICVTTDKCYDNKEWVYGYRESDRLGGYDPYSSSKACVEILTNSYKKSFFNLCGIQVATVRAGNVIGGGDWAKDRLIPDAIRSINRNDKIVVRNPLAIRPWQYVLEPLSGYLWLGCKLLSEPNKYNTCWNFGPNDESNQTVEMIITEFIRFFGKGQYTIEEQKQVHEAQVLKLDISKAKNYLLWKPVYSYKRAIENTSNWYKVYYSQKKGMYHITLRQIEQYIEKAQELNVEWCRSNE